MANRLIPDTSWLCLRGIAPKDSRLGDERGRREMAAVYRKVYDYELKALESMEQALQALV